MKPVLAASLILMLTGCASVENPTTLQFDQVQLTKSAEVLTAEPEARPKYILDSRAEIEIEDQSGDGASVAVEFARVERGAAFLVILNQAGQILGSAPIDPQSQPVTVVLTSPLAKSQELSAQLRWDDGDGVLNLDTDPILVEEHEDDVAEDFWYEVTGG